MTNLRSRLARHLSYANVMASIAVFVALGGVGYAATNVNGNSIVKRSIGAGKLKNGTLTSSQVKQNALTGSVIDEASLGIVPSAQTAASATTAGSANTAGSATTADSAKTAASATTAASASTADTAKSAIDSEHASEADHAASADHAAEATTAASALSATSAEDADTLDGLTSKQLQLSCPAGTDPYGGMCWDVSARPSTNWIAASIDCGDEGGRLPSLSEMVGFAFQEGTQLSGQNWTGDAVEFSGGQAFVITGGETTNNAYPASFEFGYRCLFYETN